MDHVIIQNIILVVMLGIVAFGLSVLKKKLLRLAEELSRKATPVCCPVSDGKFAKY